MTSSNIGTVVRLSPGDNVVVVVEALQASDRVESEDLACNGPVPRGHKIATADIKQAEPVRKYSQVIGFASCDIRRGDHVHTHNCAMGDFSREPEFCVDTRNTGKPGNLGGRTFQCGSKGQVFPFDYFELNLITWPDLYASNFLVRSIM